MDLVDHLNSEGNFVTYASAGIEQLWQMKRGLLSPKYTTSWKDIRTVYAK